MLGLTSLRIGGHYLAMVTISFQTILSLVLTNWVVVYPRPGRQYRISNARTLFGHIVHDADYLAL